MIIIREKAQTEIPRLVILTRHFFQRLFLNEIVFYEEQMIGKVISIIAILSIFPAYIADVLLFKYLLIEESGTVWVETSLFISLIMLLTGLITLFEWDVIFLDRKDYLNLIPLPIKPATLFAAKFISLVIFIGMFVIGVNSLSAFVFVIYLGQSRGYGLLTGFIFFFIHMLVMLAAGSFIFFAQALVFALFNILLKAKLWQRISDLFRLGLLVGHLYILYAFLIDTNLLKISYENIQGLKESPTAFMMNFPPLWFTGLYQVLLGSREDFFKTLASKALFALAISIGVFFLIMLFSYRQYLNKSSAEAARSFRPSLGKRLFEVALNLTFLRNHVERAVFWFYGRAMSRRGVHRTRLILYLGIGSGVTLILFASVGKLFWKFQSGHMLSLPLVLTFFLLVGLKDAINIPLNYEANWVFEITEGGNRWPYFSGLRKSIFIFILLPLYGLIFALYCWVWDWQTAAIHCLYDLALAVLLMEGLFFQHKKFPFACSYLPGKSRLHIFWLVYLLLFLAYIYIPRWIEPYFLAEGSRFISFCTFFILVETGLWLYHKYYFYPRNTLIYEDQPEPSLLELFHPV